jgi:hypothetical protein
MRPAVVGPGRGKREGNEGPSRERFPASSLPPLTFKYDDAQLAKGFPKFREIRQGYHYRLQTGGELFSGETTERRWRATGDNLAHHRMRKAQWWLAGQGRQQHTASAPTVTPSSA